MDERIRVHALEGDGGGQGGPDPVLAGEPGGGEGEDGAQAFAAGPEAVAHGLVDAGGTGRRVGRQGGHVDLQGRLHAGQQGVKFG